MLPTLRQQRRAQGSPQLCAPTPAMSAVHARRDRPAAACPCATSRPTSPHPPYRPCCLPLIRRCAADRKPALAPPGVAADRTATLPFFPGHMQFASQTMDDCKMLLASVSTIDSITSLPLPFRTAITTASWCTSMPIYLTSRLNVVASLRERSLASTESFPQGKVSFFSRSAYLHSLILAPTELGPLSHNALT